MIVEQGEFEWPLIPLPEPDQMIIVLRWDGARLACETPNRPLFPCYFRSWAETFNAVFHEFNGDTSIRIRA